MNWLSIHLLLRLCFVKYMIWITNATSNKRWRASRKRMLRLGWQSSLVFAVEKTGVAPRWQNHRPYRALPRSSPRFSCRNDSAASDSSLTNWQHCQEYLTFFCMKSFPAREEGDSLPDDQTRAWAAHKDNQRDEASTMKSGRTAGVIKHTTNNITPRQACTTELTIWRY